MRNTFDTARRGWRRNGDGSRQVFLLGGLAQVAIVALIGAFIWDHYRPHAVRRAAETYGVVPIGYRPFDPTTIVGIELTQPVRERYPTDFREARLWWCQDGVRRPITASEVWGMASRHRLQWYYTIPWGGSLQGLPDFKAYVFANLDGNRDLVEAFRIQDRNRVRWLIVLVPVLAMLAVLEYWALARGWRFPG